MEDNWIEYRQLVLQQLKEVRVSIEKINESIEQQKDDVLTIRQQLNACNMSCAKSLFGNGSPEKGLVVRTDRIEQKLGLQSKLFFVLIPLFFGAVLDFVFKK